MAINILKKTVITLAIYLIIIFGILLLQFTDGSGFFLSIDGLKISGSERINDRTGEKTPELPVFISTKGINFFVDDKNPLTAVTAEDETIQIQPLSYTKEEKCFSITFEHGVSLSFFPVEVNNRSASADGKGGGVIISAGIPAGIREIRLGYRLAAGVRFDTVMDSVVLRADRELFSFSGTSFDVGRGETLPPEVSHISIRAEHPVIVYKEFTPVQDVRIEDIDADPAASEETYLGKVRGFFATIPPLYRAAANAGTLSEPLLAAYVAESGRAGNYQQAVNAISRSFIDGSNRSHLTSVYIDNLERNWAARETRANAELGAYNEAFSARNPVVFEKKSLIRFLIEHDKTGDFPALLTLAEEAANSGALTARQAAGVLELTVERTMLPESMPTVGENTVQLCEKKIRERLHYTRRSAGQTAAQSEAQSGSSLYVTEDDKTVETRPTLETAGILYRYGAAAAKTEWRAVGRLLASTVLDRTAGTNTVPETFTLPGIQNEESQGANAAASGAALAPGDIYPLLEPVQSWYPHLVCVYPGRSVWTCAESIEITEPERRIIEITARFPVGSTHYMVVTGVPRFARIQIYEIDFRTDPKFESYNSSGYRYHADTRTLFLKMRHRSEYETVRLFIAPPEGGRNESASAPTEPPAES